MIIKIIGIFNWIIVAGLLIIFLAEWFMPSKGGDAATKGMGEAIRILALIAAVVLAVLNLIPYQWGKYAAFGLVAMPFLVLGYYAMISKIKEVRKENASWNAPIFEDQKLDKLAKLIRDGETKKLRQELDSGLKEYAADLELLQFAIAETAYTSFQPDEKLECIRILFEYGASIPDTSSGEDILILSEATNAGNADLTRFLLEKGANPNEKHKYTGAPVIFNALASHRQPVETVQVLLDSGADVNILALLDSDIGKESPLYRAARFDLWKICIILLDAGADPDYAPESGKSARQIILEAADLEYDYGEHTIEIQQKLKERLRK